MNTQDGARDILKHIEACYVSEHDYVSVREHDFAHLSLKFYGETRRFLEAKGFIFLEDCEDRTLAAAPGNVLMPVMIRTMVSADGAIMAGIFHPRIRPLWLRILLFCLGKRLGRIVDFETEFEDGSFVCTSNAMAAAAMSSPTLIESEFLKTKTPIHQLLARHQERVSAKRQATGLGFRRSLTIAEVRASQNRMNGIKAAYRGEIGGVTKEELERLSPRFAPGLATEVHQEIRNIQIARGDRARGAPLDELRRLLLRTGRQPAAGQLPEMSDWVLFHTLELKGGALQFTETRVLGLRGNDQAECFEIQVPNGSFRIEARVARYGLDARIAGLRATAAGVDARSIERGDLVKELPVDLGGIAVVDIAAVEESIARDTDAYEAWLDGILYSESQEMVSVHVWPPTETEIPRVESGFGDGTFPLHLLKSGNDTVGLEVEFIPSSEAYPS